jgi:hypothetical protein
VWAWPDVEKWAKAAAAEREAVLVLSTERTWEYLRDFVDLEARGITF